MKSIYIEKPREREGERERERSTYPEECFVVVWFFCNGWRSYGKMQGCRRGYEMLVIHSNRIPFEFEKDANSTLDFF